MRILLFQPHETLISPQGALSRLNGLLSLLQQEQFCIFLPERSAGEVRNLAVSGEVVLFKELRVAGRAVPYFLGSSPGLHRQFDAAVARFKPELAIFSFPWALSAFRRRSGVRSIYFSNGVEADFSTITLNHLGLNFPPLRRLFGSTIAAIEKRACLAADAIFAMSDVDLDRLARLYQIDRSKGWYFPQPVRLPQPAAARQAARERFGLPPDAKLVLFHGSWGHQPNREAADLIKDVIAPYCCREDGSIRFVIAGSGVPDLIGSGIISLGYVEDLAALCAACDAAVMPVLSGSGVRMKTFDYLSSGCPLVSTKKGIEGLPLKDRFECLITENDPQEISAALISLLNNPELARRLAQAGLDYLRLHHDPARLGSQLRERLNSLVI